MDGDKIDSLLTHLGTGRWNLMYFAFSSIRSFAWAPMHLSGVYVAPVVAYTCLPSLNATSLAEDSCSYVSVTEDGEEVEEACTEWLFDTTVFTSTLTSEFQLVCGRAYLRPTFQACRNLGSIFTHILWGYLADRYGRKIVVVGTHTLTGLISITMSFLPSFSLILACRVLQGVLANSILYSFAMEVCEIKQRSKVGILLGLPWAFGIMAWGGLAYLMRDWRQLNLVSSLPLLLILLVLCLDESPRWLVVTGQKERAERVLQRAARMNKVELPPEEELKKLMSLQQEGSRRRAQEQRKTKLQCEVPRLLRTPMMRRVTTSVSVVYFITALVYSGLNLSGAALSADPFLYMVLGGLMEVPGYVLTAPVISRWGRKIPLMLCFLLCGVTIVTLAFVPSDLSWLVLTLAMTGKMAVSAAFMALVVYQAELQPTEVRMQGRGLAKLAGSVGYILAPYFTDQLVLVVPWLPSVIFGVASLVISLVVLPLPETNGVALPQTSADLKVMWRRKWLSSKTGSEA